MEIDPGSIPFDGACYFTCVNEGLNIARWGQDTGLCVEEEVQRGLASFWGTAWRETAAMRMIATAKDCQRNCRDGKKNRKVPDGINEWICTGLRLGAGCLAGPGLGLGGRGAGAGPGRGIRYHVTLTHV